MAFSFPPEIFRNIFKELDVTSLHSCVLVNRTWCVNTAPILWQNPLDFVHNNYKRLELQIKIKQIINIYLSSLSDDSKVNFENNHVMSKRHFTTTFNYASFLRSLNLLLLLDSINLTFTLITRNSYKKREFIYLELIKLFLHESSCVDSLECCTLTIENDEKVDDFKVIYNDISKIPGAISCLSRLKRLRCRDKTSLLLPSLAQITKSLRTLEIFNSRKNRNMILDIIHAQSELEQFFIFYSDITSKYLDALRSNFNNLQKIFIHCSIRISFINILYEIPNIKEFSIICIGYYGSDLSTEKSRSSSIYNQMLYRARYNHYGFLNARSRLVIPPSDNLISENSLIINSNLSKLTKLEINHDENIAHVQQYIPIIQCTHGSLREIQILLGPHRPSNSSQLFTTIINNCPNLRVLGLYVPDDVISEIPRLFKTCNLLEEVYLLGGPVSTTKIRTFLKEIGDVVPQDLRCIYLGPGHWDYSSEALKYFLDCCEIRLNRKPLKFLYNHTKKFLEILEEYVEKGVLEILKISIDPLPESEDDSYGGMEGN
ncbi:5362_t:CDS:2 [Scutellospora calospora]|uniref:5362_t:CDS:1 n=1 Tax=Scutellospora calospora TaxID=85575 RepID=A0ACA9JV92_9GLOM|nr:5362_t:CDS:2 [Scutellospora calospora]